MGHFRLRSFFSMQERESRKTSAVLLENAQKSQHFFARSWCSCSRNTSALQGCAKKQFRRRCGSSKPGAIIRQSMNARTSSTSTGTCSDFPVLLVFPTSSAMCLTLFLGWKTLCQTESSTRLCLRPFLHVKFRDAPLKYFQVVVEQCMQ